MREVISVHVGQAGVQIGNACCTSLIHIVVLAISRFAILTDIFRGTVHRRAWP